MDSAKLIADQIELIEIRDGFMSARSQLALKGSASYALNESGEFTELGRELFEMASRFIDRIEADIMVIHYKLHPS